MAAIKFEDYKQRLTDAIQAKLREAPILGENGFTLVEGFIMQPINKELSGAMILGGPTIPLVAVVGNTSGRMYYFAVKALLPDLKF